MTKIVQTIWKAIDDDPSIKRDLARGLVNTSALARYLITDKHIDTTLEAAISAIRRYQHDAFTDIYTPASRLLGQTINISTRSNLAEIALTKDDDVQYRLPKVFDIIHYVRGDVLRIMQANESIRLLIDEKNMDTVLGLFHQDKVLATDKNLAEIAIHIHPKMQKTPGILSILANELSLNNINIIEAMTCPPEMLFIVKNDDFQQASTVIHRLCQTK